MNEKIIIVGDSAFAEVAYEYFSKDPGRTVAAFAVPKSLKKKDSLFAVPVVDFEDIEILYPPDKYDAFVAITNNKLNRTRTKMYNETKAKGYKLINYISSRAFVWNNTKIGDNCFVFEDNTVQPFVSIGNNCILWSGSHIGHHSVIGDNNFFTSHVVLSGFCEVGNNCFLGVNSTINNNVKIGDNVVIGSGSLIVKDVPSNSLVKGKADFPEVGINTLEKYGINE